MAYCSSKYSPLKSIFKYFSFQSTFLLINGYLQNELFEGFPCLFFIFDIREQKNHSQGSKIVKIRRSVEFFNSPKKEQIKFVGENDICVLKVKILIFSIKYKSVVVQEH